MGELVAMSVPPHPNPLPIGEREKSQLHGTSTLSPVMRPARGTFRTLESSRALRPKDSKILRARL